MFTNAPGDTGRFKWLADAEHDDPEQASTYQQQKLVKVGYIWMTQETAAAINLELEPA